MLSFAAVGEAHAAGYAGRDTALLSRVQFWIDYFGPDLPIDQVDADRIDAGIAVLMAQGKRVHRTGVGIISAGKPLSGATINRYTAALATVFRYARKRRLLPRGFVSPLRAIDKEPEGEGRFDCYSREEIDRLITAARTVRWRRLAAIIAMAFGTGLRKGALLGLRWRDIDLQARRATVGRTKNGRPIVAHLPEFVVVEIERLPKQRDPAGLVFCGPDASVAPDFRKSWESAVKIAGLRYLPFHSLRRSCASHLAARGASSVLLAETLGHRSLRMVSRYAHLDVDSRGEFVDGAFA